MTKKKICILAPFLSGKGGTETILCTCIQMLAKYYDVTLILANGVGETSWLHGLESDAVIKIIESTNKVSQVAQLLRIYMRQRFEASIVLSTNLLLLVHYFQKFFLRRHTLISWIHYSLNHEHTVDPSRLKFADYHFAISSGIANQMKNLGISSEKIYTIYNAVEAKQISKYSPNNQICRFVYIGRIMLDGQKNLRLLFDSLAKFPEDWQLDIYGTGADTEKCKDYVQKLGIASHVHWKGYVEKAWDNINDVTALLLSSQFEGFPMVLLEALSYGIPVVSVNCPTGPADMIDDAVNGVLVRSMSSDMFEKSLIKVTHKQYDSEHIKSSIASYYLDAYEERLIGSLEMILDGRKIRND
ncbi:glycosyltransferase [Lactiplantibacillus plantarum]|uniref:glycosyltransferase n=1 Tax=Lactiplantibacillus plantarum TaxID=1590 RepID=UPI00159219F9|nr:glycosyltransferase [Lactiplantibacillus plantarum]QKX10209.1 Poly(glycerol-phosphate)alpha-glucosyltransferase [Lactiplantibacillus plantarum]